MVVLVSLDFSKGDFSICGSDVDGKGNAVVVEDRRRKKEQMPRRSRMHGRNRGRRKGMRVEFQRGRGG